MTIEMTSKQYVEKLAPRELEVITLTAFGKTRSEIAETMSVSEETVEAYVERARIKLNAVNKTHASTTAIALGLITPSQAVPQQVTNKNVSDVPPKKTGTALATVELTLLQNETLQGGVVRNG